jgi:ATP-dependent Clp protease adapter protein ClpS
MTTKAQPQEGTSNIVIEPWNVIILNDNVHTFDEVIAQIMKATGCSPDHAADVAWKIHNEGEAVCFTGSKERAELVASILEELNLRVRLESA